MPQRKQKPKISLITVSLNQGRFLREMIDSIINQSFTDYEHIIVDGASTDNTIDILKDYSNKYRRIRWISEKDESAGEAFIKAVSMARGKYIIQCCTSDGFLDRDWFKRCVDILDNDDEVSLVFGLPQYMTEDGRLGKVTCPGLLDEPPPQKQDFFSFWLATGSNMHEGNHCVRREVFEKCFPKSLKECQYRDNMFIDFVYNFNTLGYLPIFIQVVANFGRTHKDAVGQVYRSRDLLLGKRYRKEIEKFRRQLFRGEVTHYFRNGSSEIIGEITKNQMCAYKKRFYKIKIKQFMNYTIYQAVRFVLRKCHLFKLREWLMSW
jgi:glycosyltransferase involved in cell wall biosynthesis